MVKNFLSFVVMHPAFTLATAVLLIMGPCPFE